MSPPLHQPQSRLAEDPTSDLQGLLASASELAPPQGTQERIWQRLANPYGRIVDNAAEDVVLVDLLRRAADVEPSLETRTRIWRQLNEEAAARAGLAEPRRLIDSDELSSALLASEVALEPPYARQTRLYRQMAPKRTFSWPRFAVATSALAACALLAFPIFKGLGTRDHRHEQIAEGRISGGAPGFHGGEAVALNSGEDKRRWQFDGVGDCVLSGEGASVTVASSDEHGVRLRLERGSISIHAVKRSKDSPLIIEANGVVAQVVGTILTVEAIPGGANVFVHEGLVQVSSAGHEPALIGADQAWPNPFSKPPPWAAETMSTLAGVAVAPHTIPAAPAMVAMNTPEHIAPVAAHAVAAHPSEAAPAPAVVAQAPAARHEAKVVPVVVAPVAAAPAVPVAAAPAAPVAAATPVAAPTVAAPTPALSPVKPGVTSVTKTTVVVEMPATPPPATAAAALPEPTVSAGPHFDLDAAELAYARYTLEEISQAIGPLQRGGPEKLKPLAGAFRALAHHEANTEAERMSAHWNLIAVLDNQMGAVDMAITELRKLAPSLSGSDLSRARISILQDLVEIHRDNEAIGAAADCLRECSPEHRVVALTLRPQRLMNVGRIEEAREATRLAQQDPYGRAKAAFYFARRAMDLSGFGQQDRARMAALLSLSLDPTSPSAAELRRKFK